MDNLTRDVLAAEKAGMHYGDWKALHPYTNPDNLHLLNPVKKPTKKRPEPEKATPEHTPPAKQNKCPICGRMYEVHKDFRKACSIECQKLYKRNQTKERMARYRERQRWNNHVQEG